MVTTGLVSLNVHEALSFDGTPICLHPDLFSTVAEVPSYHSGTTTVVAANRSKDSRLPLNATMSSDDTGAGKIYSSLSDNNKGLQVGDMLEIRVWDPLPKARTASSSNVSSIMRRTATHLNGSNSAVLQPYVVPSSSSSAVDAIDDSINHRSNQSASNRANNFTQHSDGSVTSVTELEGTGKADILDSVTVSSGDHTQPVVNITPLSSPIPSSKSGVMEGDASELPPVVPRFQGESGRNSVAKPPLQRRTSQQQEAFKQQQQQPARLSKPRHVRDLSDMTVDSACGAAGTTALETSQQLLDFYLPTGVSLGDEDDDLWLTLLNTHRLRLSFIMLVTEKTLTSLKGSARTQVSILRQVADLYHLSSYDMVSIHRVSRDEEEAALEAVSADFLLVTIKGQFISRGDMHFFQESLIGSWVYEGQRLSESTRGLQANAREIRHSEQQALSGIVTDKTLITFRSRSSRIIWLVHMSSEMWEYGSPYERDQEESKCEIYFDKWIAFIHKLFAKWKELEATHSLTVVFFSRSYLNSLKTTIHETDEQQDVYGRRYEDHFRVVLENETGPDWDSLVVRVKEAFVRYPSEVGWNLSSGDKARRPSAASQGNVLEAINVTLNLLQFHYLDRDLHRTGNSIVVVSAGNGVFEVDRGLAGITYQRMMDNGIGSDVLSLGLPTLHIAPFFLYKNVHQSDEMEDVATQEQYYEVPHWMHLSFVSYESDDAVFVDHLYEDEKKQRERKLVANQAGVEIVANGFLLPRAPDSISEVETQAIPLIHPTSFTALGNAAASPARKAKTGSSERQLIDGRDFRDILEACRPRTAGMLPSALTALLQINDSVRNREVIRDEKVGESASLDDLEEWGTLDLNLIMGDSSGRLGRRTSSLDQDPDESTSLLRCSNNSHRAYDSLRSKTIDVEIHPGIETSSHSTSVSSQVSSDLLGALYDCPYHARQVSRHSAAVELQRSVSLGIAMIEDDDSDASLSTDDRSSSDAGHSTTSRKKIDFVESLREMMRNHDAAVVGRPSPKRYGIAEPSRALIDTSDGEGSRRVSMTPGKTQTGFEVKQRFLHGSQGTTTGGLGAALTQYRSTPSAAMHASEFEPASSSLSRTISLGRVSVNKGQAAHSRMLAIGSRGTSPLLIPAVASALPDIPDRKQDGTPSVPIPFERRFLRLQDYATGRSIGGLASSRKADTGFEFRKREGRHQQHYSRSLSVSPPTNKTFGSPPKEMVTRLPSTRDEHATGKQSSRHRGSTPPPRSGLASRKKKVFNPFRQEDEVEVLAMKSHNRRRWSHVFPLGEVEFKRHAGPNWKSLTAPAILPLSIDYFPKQEEIDRNFTFSIYNVTLSEFDHKNYSSNKDLLVEMVRQRLTQDFQLVSEDCINASNYRRETLHEGLSRARLAAVVEEDSPEIIRQFLSMGHRLHAITYDPSADLIEVTRYDAKDAQMNSTLNTFKYQYLSYCQETNSYSKVRQIFLKYSDQYNWNKVDRIICGDDDREMREGMRFKRLMFGVIPDNFHGDLGAEEAYVAKFRRFLEYLEKLRDKEDSKTPLDIRFVTSVDKQHQEENKRMESTPGLARNSMARFYIQLRKGKRDNLEWMEVAIDSTFDTSWSYRIMFNWLVASSGKVDAQVQLLQRRCTQYGLKLIPFPQISVSRNCFANPFKAPAILAIHFKIDVLQLERALSQVEFVHDGVFHTDVDPILAGMEDGGLFSFDIRWGKTVTGKQFVHRSGTLFVRVLTDLNGLLILVVLGNYRYMMTNKSDTVVESYRSAFKTLAESVAALKVEEIIEPESALFPRKEDEYDNSSAVSMERTVSDPP